jgi:NADH-quinone oxidoreductase subunit G
MLVEDDPISDGWLCDRGRYNVGFYESPDRLTQPLYRKQGRFVQIGWDDAFILWAKAITEAVATRGPASVGAIGGGRLTNEEAFVLQHLFRSLGVANLDWRIGRQRQATPGRKNAPLNRIDRAAAIVIVGESLAQRAPILWLRVRKAALQRGAGIVQERDAPAARKAVGDVSSVALIWDGIDLEQGRAYAQAFADIADLSTYIASEQANARGAEAMGMLPFSGPAYHVVDTGLDGYAMLDAASAGRLAVLSIFGVNPSRNAIDPVAAAHALEKVPFLAVSELFMTETARSATLVLPAKGAFEKTGTTIGLSGDLLPVNASLAAPDFVRSDLDMLQGLADELDVSIPAAQELHRVVVALAAKATPDFNLGDQRFEVSRVGPASSNGASILSGGGTWEHDPWLGGMRA